MTNITPCSLGNGCCTFGFLISIIPERSFLYHSLYTPIEKIIKAPLLHQSLGLWVFFCLSLSFIYFLIIDSVPPGSGPFQDPSILSSPKRLGRTRRDQVFWTLPNCYLLYTNGSNLTYFFFSKSVFKTLFSFYFYCTLIAVHFTDV